MTLNLLPHKNQMSIVNKQLGLNHTALAEKGQYLMVGFFPFVGFHKYPVETGLTYRPNFILEIRSTQILSTQTPPRYRNS